jgi:hypothetical protein
MLNHRTAHVMLPHGTNIHDRGQLVQRNHSPEIQESGALHQDFTTIRSLIIHKHDLQFCRPFLDRIPKLFELLTRCSVDRERGIIHFSLSGLTCMGCAPR